MADPGSVSYLFSRKGVITIEKVDGVSEDKVLEVGLDAGIEDVEVRESSFVVTTDPSAMVPVRTALQAAGLDYESADVEFVPAATLPVDAETARTVFKIIDALEDSDEVQNVYANFDISSEVLAELEA
jgi:transcriptional/translational regulatory protein YebC/TACO1